MKKIVLASLLGCTMLGASVLASAKITHVAAIQNVLSSYETALNAQDTDTIVSLYADDGVFMPQHSQPQIGHASIRAAYDGVFTAITLDISFEVDEIELLSQSWAFARTRSEGTVQINATGKSGREANQELFLFQLDADGDWKIARYIFSTTTPPRS